MTNPTLVMQIFFNHYDGKTITMDIEPTDTVETMRLKMYEKKGVPPDCISFIFAGKHLYDHQTLEECGIIKESKVHWVILPQRKDS